MCECLETCFSNCSQQERLLCMKISWKQSDYNIRNGSFFFISNSWWKWIWHRSHCFGGGNRQRQSGGHWRCPLSPWKGELLFVRMHAILNPALMFRVPKKILLQFCIVITLQSDYCLHITVPMDKLGKQGSFKSPLELALKRKSCLHRADKKKNIPAEQMCGLQALTSRASLLLWPQALFQSGNFFSK